MKRVLSFTPHILLIFMLTTHIACSQQAAETELDKKVKAFLDKHKSSWRDLNVPYQDGQVLHDIILEKGYMSALEIGTSTGHSTIWIAWAMSKTGGKVTTIEIDEGRHREALKNIEEAGLSAYVDARLADAHKLVPQLKGPFDFVFSDADKDWYTQYFIDVDPNLKMGGCFTAHNVRNGFSGANEFVEYVKSLNNYTTTIDTSSRSGISISYKQSR